MDHYSQKPIYVTQPSMPPLEEFTKYLEKIWDNKILTNNGPFHQQFEKALADYLGVKHISLFTNGTLALMVGLQALRITGEVITTPFSFVATTHSLYWNGIKPVFCDIEEKTCNLDPHKIEALITPKTTAILPVHVYGNPCDNKKIQDIADTYGLKVIYDAAHAFGVKENNETILNWGDLSILSFHATKSFNTIEGGAIVTNDEKIKKRIDYAKNFGYANETTVVSPGINAKMNEIQAAFGILQLDSFDKEVKKRKEITKFYLKKLDGVKGITFLNDFENVTHNYSYFPIQVNHKEYGCSRDEIYETLKKHNIYGRRYFYPLISQFPTYSCLPSAASDNLPVAEKISKEILCLPIYGKLAPEIVETISDILKQ